jgi:hypothetical protein
MSRTISAVPEGRRFLVKVAINGIRQSTLLLALDDPEKLND